MGVNGQKFKMGGAVLAKAEYIFDYYKAIWPMSDNILV